ncbi:MAG: DUF4189 domain-containing protein [Rhizobiales bacterium]|nr:DUF4189 domain-containing protein [Hyphomicrobiales bacterium]
MQLGLSCEYTAMRVRRVHLLRRAGECISTILLLATLSLTAPVAHADDAALLAAHNAHRARHCVPPLSWSNQLAAEARQWAAACTFQHSPQAFQGTNGFGENLFWGTGQTDRSAVDWWYNEIARYNFDAPRFSNDIAHFTQLVWRASTQLGCGVANCGGRTYWVCRYSPPGNWNVNNPGVLAANVPRQCTGQPGGGASPGGGAAPAPQGGGATPGGRGQWSAFATNYRGYWGYGVHQADQGTASQLALNGCGGSARNCKVFWTTTDRCVAYAESRSGGFWLAAGGGTSADGARANALRFCQSGTAPAGTCAVKLVNCR